MGSRGLAVIPGTVLRLETSEATSIEGMDMEGNIMSLSVRLMEMDAAFASFMYGGEAITMVGEANTPLPVLFQGVPTSGGLEAVLTGTLSGWVRQVRGEEGCNTADSGTGAKANGGGGRRVKALPIGSRGRGTEGGGNSGQAILQAALAAQQQ